MKKVGFMLCLVLLLIVTACGEKKADTNDQQQRDASKESGANQVSEKAASTDKNETTVTEIQTVSIFTESTEAWPYREDWALWDWIEEETGIRVKADIAVGNRSEAMNLAIASQTLSDIAFGFGELIQLGRDGAFIDVSEHLDKMPNVANFFEQNPQIKKAVTMPDGAIYLLPRFGSQITDYRIWFNREEIFKEHQLQQPTNWEELYEVSKQLKTLYPDTYPFMFRHGLATLSVMAPSFNTANNFYRNLETGEVNYGPIEDNYKLLVEWLHKFAQDELIPPDWLSMDYATWLRYINNNQGFIAIQYIGQKEIVNNQGEAGWWEYLPPMEGVDGRRLIPNHFGLSGYAINAQTKNLEASLKLLDFMYSDKGTEILSWGKEGITYDNATDKKQFKEGIQQFTDLRVDYGIMTSGSFAKFDPQAVLALVAEKELESYVLSEQYEDPALQILPNLTEEEQDLVTIHLPNIHKHYEENISRFIIGSRPLSEWDQYVEEMQKLNLEMIREIYQTAWER